MRLNLDVSATGVTVTSKTVIASGYQHRGDPAAFEVGPTGLVYDPTLMCFMWHPQKTMPCLRFRTRATRPNSGGTGTVIYSDAVHLHGPLAMAEAPNGDLIVANSDVINSNPALPSEYVEFTKQGQFISATLNRSRTGRFIWVGSER